MRTQWLSAKVGSHFVQYAAAVCGLFLLGFVAYWPALGGEPIWDDIYLIGQNPFFRSPVFVFESFKHWLFFNSFSTYYRPVQNGSYSLDYWLWGGDPFGFHVTNVALHCFTAFLIFLLVRRLLPTLMGKGGGKRDAIASLLVVGIWVIHPVHNAAVAYISGRADSLAALFALGAWLIVLSVRGIRSRIVGIGCSLVGACSALLALCSKEIALVWVGLFSFYLLFFERGMSKRTKVLHLAGIVCVVGVYAVLHSLPESRWRPYDGPPPQLSERGVLMLRALGDYTGLMIWPVVLHMERTLSDPAALGSARAWAAGVGFEYLSVLGFITLVFAIRACCWKAPGLGLRRFGIGWFAIAFLPISNLFPLNAEVAEHWIYLASIGFLLAIAGCLFALPPRWQSFAAIAATVAIFPLGIRTAVRAGDWVNAETFCLRRIESGGASPRMFSTLADVYARRGDLEKQERMLRKCIELYPKFVPARFSLGGCLRRQGRLDEALAFLDFESGTIGEVAGHFPETWSAAIHLSRAYADAGKTGSAFDVLAEARRRFPENWDLVRCEAGLRKRDGELGVAEALVASYVRDHWWHADARFSLAELRAESGDGDGAVADLRQAARFDIHDARAFAFIARLELARGRGEAAVEAQCLAVERRPRDAAAYLALAAILNDLGREPEAEAAVRRARSLAPELAQLSRF